MKQSLINKERTLQQFREDLDRFQGQIRQVDEIEETSDIDIIRVNKKELKNHSNPLYYGNVCYFYFVKKKEKVLKSASCLYVAHQ